MHTFTIEIEKDENFYVVQCIEHSSCFTQGETIEKAIHNIKEVIELILNVKHPKLKIVLKDELINAL